MSEKINNDPKDLRPMTDARFKEEMRARGFKANQPLKDEAPAPKRAPFADKVSAVRHQITDHPLRNVGIVTAGAAIAGSLYGLANDKGGNEHLPLNGELSNISHILTLDEGAILRFDPIPKDEADDHNGILQLQGPLEVVSTAVFEGTPNGTWYGIPDEVLQHALGATNDKAQEITDDRDDMIWVNEQGVLKVGEGLEPKSDNPDDYIYPDPNSNEE